MDHAPAAPSHPHGHSHDHGHHHAHTHGHGGMHAHPAAAPAAAGFSLIALSAPMRLLLALPPVAVLWLLTGWALGNG